MLFAFQRLFRRAEREDGQDRAEDFLPRDAVARGDLREKGRGKKYPCSGKARRVEVLHPSRPTLDEFGDFVELLQLMAPTSVFLSSGSPTRSAPSRCLSLRSRLGDRLLHEQPRARAAHLGLVEVDAVDDALDRLVERGVVEDDVRRLAAELERQLFPVPASAR